MQADDEINLDPSIFQGVNDMKNRSNSTELAKAADPGRSDVEAAAASGSCILHARVCEQYVGGLPAFTT